MLLIMKWKARGGAGSRNANNPFNHPRQEQGRKNLLQEDDNVPNDV
jgi:hypothetical protein